MRRIIVVSFSSVLATMVFACESRPREAEITAAAGRSAFVPHKPETAAVQFDLDGTNDGAAAHESSQFFGYATTTGDADPNTNGLPPGRRSLDDPALLKLADNQAPAAIQLVSAAAPGGAEWGLPVTGYEPKFEPLLWNDPLVRLGHNCYAYACNDLNRFRLGSRDFPQPGVTGGLRPPNAMNYTLDELRRRAIADGLTYVQPMQEKQAVPAGFYRTALFVQPGVDYHWYRQDPDGYWSHKLAGTLVSRTDAAGSLIADPRLADRNYEHIPNPSTGEPIGFNYTQFAGFFYVPDGGIRLLTPRPNMALTLNRLIPPPHGRPGPAPGPGRH